MFKFEFIDKALHEKFLDLPTNYPPEVCQEIPQFLEALERDGQVSRVEYFIGNINKISAKTFELHFISDHSQRTIKIIDIRIKPMELLKERFSIQDDWNDSDIVEVIPQCDPPAKLISALELIADGITNSYDLGHALGHKGKQAKDISRHGQYTFQALECLKLITRQKRGRAKFPELTERGNLIATANEKTIKEKLITVAMLNYRPVWEVINAITEGDEDFDDETIKILVFPEEDRDADTCPRRIQTLKSWIRWISKTEGIPIRLPGGVTQLVLSLEFGGSVENL
jgi:hypothetical protein